MLLSSVVALLAVLVQNSPAQPLTVCSYNVESVGSDPDVVGQRLAETQGVDMWGLSQVQSPDGDLRGGCGGWRERRLSAAHGHNGRDDPLVIVYAGFLELVNTAEEVVDDKDHPARLTCRRVRIPPRAKRSSECLPRLSTSASFVPSTR
jgi:hypothetical protein